MRRSQILSTGFRARPARPAAFLSLSLAAAVAVLCPSSTGPLAADDSAGSATARRSASQVYSQALTAWRDGDYAGADRLLSGLIGNGTSDPRVYYFRGLSRFAAGDHDAAAVDFEAGARLEAQQSARVNVSKSLERVQGPARHLLEKYRRQARNDVDFQAGRYRRSQAKRQLYAAARSAYFRGDYPRAVDLLDRVLKEGSDDPRVYYFRGLALRQLDRQEDAQADFARAVSLETAPGNQIDVDRSLERVQGPARQALEAQRGTVLFALRQQEAERRRAMIASLLERRLDAGPGSGAGATAQSTLTAPPAIADTEKRSATAGRDAQESPVISTAWLDPETEVLIHIRVADLWNSPLIRQFHDHQELKQFVSEMETQTGLTPAVVSSVTIGLVGAAELSGIAAAAPDAGPAALAAGPGALAAGQEAMMQAREKTIIVIRTRFPFDTAPIERHDDLFEKVSHNGQSYYRSLDPEQGPCIYPADLNTLVLADELPLQEAIDRGPDAQPRPEFAFVDPAKQIVMVFAPADPFALTADIPDDNGTGSPGLDALAAAVRDQTLAVGLGIGLTSNVEIEAAVLGVDDAAAEQMNAAFTDVLEELKGLWDLSKFAAPEPIVPLVDSLLRSMRGKTRDEVFAVSTRITQGQIEKLVADVQEMLPQLMMGALETSDDAERNDLPATFRPGTEPASTPTPEADRVAEDLTITASAQIARLAEFVNGTQVRPIELNLDLVGTDAARAAGYGFLELQSATDNNGSTLALNGSGLPFGAFQSSVAAINREDFFVEHPNNGCRVTIRLQPPETAPSAIASARGRLKLLVIEDSQDVIIENVRSLLGQTVSSPQLTAAGFELKLSEVTEDGDTAWRIDWTNPPANVQQAQNMISGLRQGISTPELIDADGNTVGRFSTFTSSFNSNVSVQWNAAVDQDNPFPDDVRLRIRVNSKASIVDVPFSVQDIPIAAGQ